MKTSVTLQNPFSYSLWPIVLAEVVLLILTLLLVFLFINSRNKKAAKKEQPKPQVHKVVTQRSGTDAKSAYLRRIDGIEKKYQNGELSGRECYQELSSCVREFVSEVSGVNVISYTLSDIQSMQMPSLETLIADYYHPEFAREAGFEVEQAIMEAKRVINTWN